MSQTLLDSSVQIQVYGPNLSEEVQLCWCMSFPSGSVLVRSVPQADFIADRGKALLDSLSNAVESILQEDFVIAAAGNQGIDLNELIFDAVTFTVEYVPPFSIPGQIRGTVEIPVYLIVADTSFGGAITGPTAQELLIAEYNRLKALAGG